MAAMLEDAELLPQPEIDRAASKLLGRKRRSDLDLGGFQVAPDIDVGENHLLMIEDRVFPRYTGREWRQKSESTGSAASAGTSFGRRSTGLKWRSLRRTI